MFCGLRTRAEDTYRLLSMPCTAFVVVAAPEPDALREASYFVERLSADTMPLAGLVVNRTHPVLARLSGPAALAAADQLGRAGEAPLAAAMLRLHADRVAVADREGRLVARFTKAHPAVALASVPAMPADVHDLPGLREIGERLAGG